MRENSVHKWVNFWLSRIGDVQDEPGPGVRWGDVKICSNWLHGSKSENRASASRVEGGSWGLALSLMREVVEARCLLRWTRGFGAKGGGRA